MTRSSLRRALVLGLTIAGCGFGPKPELPAPPPSATEMAIGSTVEGGGELAIDFDFDTNGTARLTPSSSLGDAVLYSAIDPSFDLLAASIPQRSIYVLPGTATVSIELVSADPGASVRVGTTLLNEPGEVAEIGSEPGAHLHPEWRIVWPIGQAPPDRQIKFRVVARRGEFAPSAEYSIHLTTRVSVLAEATRELPQGAPR